LETVIGLTPTRSATVLSVTLATPASLKRVLKVGAAAEQGGDLQVE
jgi:hypothetical protein